MNLAAEIRLYSVDGSLAYDYGTASWMENGERLLLYYVDIYRFEDGAWKMQLSSWNTSEGIVA